MGQPPAPDAVFGLCDECERKTRLFEFNNCWICLKCYREMLEAVIDAIYEEGSDAAT